MSSIGKYTQKYSEKDSIPDRRMNQRIETSKGTQKRRKLKKKVKIYFWSMIVIFAYGFYIVHSQSESLKDRQEELKIVESEYKAVQKENSELEQLVKQLNDEEYLLKIARRDYFLSKEGEIIFQMGNAIEVK